MTAEEHYLKGASLAGEKRYEEALAELRQAVALEPDLLDAHEVIGLVHLDRGDLPAAEEVFRGMIGRDPEHLMAHVNLSRIYQRQGKIKEAEAMQARARLLSWKDELGGRT